LQKTVTCTPCTSGSQTVWARPKSEFGEHLATEASNSLS